MYSEYFSDELLDHLIDTGIKPEHINDDTLWLRLPTLYQNIGEAVVNYLDLSCYWLHLDSTTFQYDDVVKLSDDEDDIDPIHITKGYSRAHRPNLNQVVLYLICENQSGIPAYMKTVSGNINDMKGFKAIVKSHIASLKHVQSCRYLGAELLYRYKVI